jgi:hypothetical protein
MIAQPQLALKDEAYSPQRGIHPDSMVAVTSPYERCKEEEKAPRRPPPNKEERVHLGE